MSNEEGDSVGRGAEGNGPAEEEEQDLLDVEDVDASDQEEESQAPDADADDGKFKMRFISRKTFQLIKNSQKSLIINDLVQKVVDQVEANPNFKINRKWNNKENRSFEHGNV